ncbi:MAG: hypothetical protein J6S87_01310 [Bacteroidales bacterium]|nr:hypothetical protein [Bacteroidales bacterium]
MKKLYPIIAVLVFVFAACDSGDVKGGRYFGTFKNTTNNKYESGSLSFKHEKINDTTCFFMNGLLPMFRSDKNIYSGIVGDYRLNDLIKTIPAIDSIQVCDSTETIVQLNADAEFKGNSVKATLLFTTYPDSAKVSVEFVGYNE